MAHFLGGSQMMRGTWKAAQSTRTFLIQGISAWHGGLGAHPRSLWINTQARVWSVQTETRHSWGKCCLLKLEPPPEDFSDSYQRASPLGAREMAWPGSSILLEKSGCSSKAPWASWWQGGKSQMESPFILSGAVDISKCALRAHFQRHGGRLGAGRGPTEEPDGLNSEQTHGAVTGWIITSSACFPLLLSVCFAVQTYTCLPVSEGYDP